MNLFFNKIDQITKGAHAILDKPLFYSFFQWMGHEINT